MITTETEKTLDVRCSAWLDSAAAVKLGKTLKRIRRESRWGVGAERTVGSAYAMKMAFASILAGLDELDPAFEGAAAEPNKKLTDDSGK